MNICFTSKQKNSDSKLKDDTKKKNKGKKKQKFVERLHVNALIDKIFCVIVLSFTF